MPNPVRSALKRLLPDDAVETLRAQRTVWSGRAKSAVDDPRQFNRGWIERDCPICGFGGRFWSFGSPPRAEAMCPRCMSLERHRLIQLLFDRHLDTIPSQARVLHFAPEPFIQRKLGTRCHYVGVDIAPYNVACACSMERLPFPRGCFDLVMANHVLEHIPDEDAAFAEIRRVLRTDGVCILSVPQVFGWERTYEDDAIVEPRAREIHFGQWDHRRLYGRDFAHRLGRAGFDVAPFQANRADEIRFSLSRGETLYVAQPSVARDDARDYSAAALELISARMRRQ